ncbi:FKBP-type peptidyl-prolyl cis-trans isomerase [Geomonas sp. Red32]|uniref:FKBP-type peptidyl-prolyl cis-trans isomerase n=1 Tax=Geomonas sp. Red32 TaxID=2912856 RepID=UPI00202CD534|nr:FKBP-type peptidyl-prolyl cis-trans isomerase [Geomonas sp. Red32]MCM0080349.1 FKBP-type peptidyl-prolyl cis-trans isomerase [Geomonas sp. Red32]
MLSEPGKKVRILYRLTAADGKAQPAGEWETADYVSGAGSIPPSLERAVAEMRPGERRSLRIPAEEAGSHPLVPAIVRETPPGIAYDFGPGDGGDVDEFIPRRPRAARMATPPGSDLYLEVELVTRDEPEEK